MKKTTLILSAAILLCGCGISKVPVKDADNTLLTTNKELNDFTGLFSQNVLKPMQTGNKGDDPVLTISNGLNRPHLAIGIIADSVTSLSRTYAMYEIFKKNPLIINGDTLYPLITDYHFNTFYAIRGYCNESGFTLKISKGGNKFKEIKVADDWKAVYNAVARALLNDENAEVAARVKAPDEGGVDKVNSRKIRNCMPGTIDIDVPRNTILDTFSSYVNVAYYNPKNSFETLKKLYGKYITSDEKDLFFFRNNQVPSGLKTAARPLVFPLSNSLMPCLTYLSVAKQLEEEQDLGAAANALQSCLMTSNKLLASNLEKSLIRSIAFNEMSKLQQVISDKRILSTALFALGAKLNSVYTASAEATEARKKYYDGIAEVEKLCTAAEKKAFEIRGQKRFGGFMALTAAAGSVATISAYDNTISNSFMDQATTYLTTSMDAATQVSNALQQQFAGINDKIDAGSALTSDASKAELGKSFLAAEVGYYLLASPLAVKDVLYNFAADKLKCKELLDAFYSINQSAANLQPLLIYFTEMEKNILNYEVRNIAVPANIISAF